MREDAAGCCQSKSGLPGDIIALAKLTRQGVRVVQLQIPQPEKAQVIPSL